MADLLSPLLFINTPRLFHIPAARWAAPASFKSESAAVPAMEIALRNAASASLFRSSDEHAMPRLFRLIESSRRGADEGDARALARSKCSIACLYHSIASRVLPFRKRADAELSQARANRRIASGVSFLLTAFCRKAKPCAAAFSAGSDRPASPSRTEKLIRAFAR